MDKEAQRIAIAEICGWAMRTRPDGSEAFSCSEDVEVPVPDYLNDLNAMHEAEEMVMDWSDYYHELLEVCLSSTTGVIVVHGIAITHATASQRAEAFLKTFEKWTG